jgi:heme/copper-type cytochrome/quinol oxidase subunit 2
MIRSALFWIAAACCVFAEVAILRSLLFGRARRAEAQHAASASRVRRTTRPAEIAWALLPAVGLLFVLYLTWRAVDNRPAPGPDVSRLDATIGA